MRLQRLVAVGAARVYSEVHVGGDGVECLAAVRRGRDPGVLFLHGYAFTYNVWLESGAVEVPERLGLSWAAPDMPYGKMNSCTSKTASVDVNLAVARDALRAANAREAVVVGASMGARFAVYLAHSGVARGLMLVGPALGRDERAWELARTTRVPALIIWGREDTVVPWSSVERLHKLMPNSKLEVIEGAGHVVHKDNPDVFKALLEEFLRSLTTRPGGATVAP